MLGRNGCPGRFVCADFHNLSNQTFASNVAAEPRLETTKIRLAKRPALCVAPLLIVEELLRADGFTDIRYADTIEPEVTAAAGSGKVDFSMAYASQFVAGLDAGDPVTSLAGVMAFAPEPQELRARKIGHVLVNTALDRMLADGIVSRIYASYGIDQSLPTKP